MSNCVWAPLEKDFGKKSDILTGSELHPGQVEGYAALFKQFEFASVAPHVGIPFDYTIDGNR